MDESQADKVAKALAGADPIKACIADLITRYPEPLLRDASIAMLQQFARTATNVSPVEAAATFAAAILCAVSPSDWNLALAALPAIVERNRQLHLALGGSEGPAKA